MKFKAYKFKKSTLTLVAIVLGLTAIVSIFAQGATLINSLLAFASVVLYLVGLKKINADLIAYMIAGSASWGIAIVFIILKVGNKLNLWSSVGNYDGWWTVILALIISVIFSIRIIIKFIGKAVDEAEKEEQMAEEKYIASLEKAQFPLPSVTFLYKHLTGGRPNPDMDHAFLKQFMLDLAEIPVIEDAFIQGWRENTKLTPVSAKIVLTAPLYLKRWFNFGVMRDYKRETEVGTIFNTDKYIKDLKAAIAAKQPEYEDVLTD